MPSAKKRQEEEEENRTAPEEEENRRPGKAEKQLFLPSASFCVTELRPEGAKETVECIIYIL